MRISKHQVRTAETLYQAHDNNGLPNLSKIPIERLQEVEKRLQRKMRAMQEAGVPVLVAAATANHIVQDLLKEALSGRDSGKGAPMQ